MDDFIKILSPPFICNESESYYSCLEHKFKLFQNFLKESDFNGLLSTKDYSEIEVISKTLLETIDEYLKGNSGDSYKKIESIFASGYFNPDNITYKLGKQNSLIRIRKSATNLHKRNDLFHIPFVQRQKVAKQRFSIEGLPCLYLAATSYTAWLELNKPNFNEIWVSAFRTTAEIPIFDLSYTLSKLLTDFGILEDLDKTEVVDKLKLFPVVLATSFRVKYPNDFFHQEYIVSGKLLQWIVNNTKFKGIRFLSTKLESYDNNEYLWCASNFVIPPENHSREELYNEFLRTTFRLTKPQNWSVLLAYSNAGNVTAFAGGDANFNEFTAENLSDKDLSSGIDELIFENYINTAFYNVDGYLNRLFKFDVIE